MKKSLFVIGILVLAVLVAGAVTFFLIHGRKRANSEKTATVSQTAEPEIQGRLLDIDGKQITVDNAGNNEVFGINEKTPVLKSDGVTTGSLAALTPGIMVKVTYDTNTRNAKWIILGQ